MGFEREDRSATGRRRVFHLLDAVRGLAAFAIAQRHAAYLFGTAPWPSTYLAVDLFFVLSGFVIAHSYERRLLDGMTLRRFMALRAIRLYPLYAIGLTLGTAALVGHELRSPAGTVGWSVLLQALLSAGLLLPNWYLPAIVGPRWSLTYELVANAGYAAIVRFLTTPVLFSVTVASGAALAMLVAANRVIDVGWQYDQAPTALARVCFSFGFGLLLHRIHSGQASRWWALASAVLAICLSALAFGLLVEDDALVIELVLVFAGFPLLTMAAACLDVRGAAAAICGVLGTTSYALYIVHQPAGILYDVALRRMFGNDVVPAWWVGWSFLILLGLTAWLLDRFYDGPARRRLVVALDRVGRVSRRTRHRTGYMLFPASAGESVVVAPAPAGGAAGAEIGSPAGEALRASPTLGASERQ